MEQGCVQLLLLAGVIFFSHSEVQAASIKQLILEEGKATIEMTDEEKTQAHPYFLATHDGKQCRLSVVLRKESLAVVSTKDCAFQNELLIGQSLEAPLISESAPEVKEEPKVSKETKEALPAPAPQATPSAVSRFSRSVTDLVFLPASGQSYFNFDYAMASATIEADYLGSNVYKVDDSARSISMNFAYGFADNLSFVISDSFLLEDEMKYVYGPASSSSGQKKTFISEGSKDPAVGFAFRGLEQSESAAFNVDFLFAYLTGFQSAKESTSTEKGNAARGGDGYLGGISLSRKLERVSFRASLSYESFNKRTQKTGTTQTDLTGGNLTTLEISWQVKSNDYFLINATLGHRFTASSELTTGSTVVSVDHSTTSYLGLDLDVVVVPEKVVWQIGAKYFGPESTTVRSSGNSVDFTQEGFGAYHTGFLLAF